MLKMTHKTAHGSPLVSSFLGDDISPKRCAPHASMWVIAIGVVLAMACSAIAGEAYHRYYFDQQVPLDLDITRVVVYQDLQSEPPPPPLGPVLAAHGIDPATIAPIFKPGWFTAATPEWVQDGEDVELLVAELAADDGLDFAGPVFLNDHLDQLIPTHDIVLRFDQGVPLQQQQQTIADSGAGEILDQDWGMLPNAWRLRNQSGDGFVALSAANDLAVHELMRWAETDFITVGKLHACLPNDPQFSSSWRDLNYAQTGGAQDVDMDTAEAWTISTGDQSIKVAILDVGTQLNHGDLNVEVGVDIYANYPFFAGTGQPQNGCDNHGTAVAGVVSAINNNGIGVVGVATDCVSAPVRIGESAIPCTTAFSTSSGIVVFGITWAWSEGYLVTVNSYSLGFSSSSIADAFTYTRSNGMLHFASTGNAGVSSIGYPASLSAVVAVGGINSSGTSYGNFGTGIDFVGPAVSIPSTDRTGAMGYGGGDYTTVTGTSFSCPAAAAVAALIWSVNDSLSPDEVEEIMQDTAVDLGTSGYDTTFGYGLINAHQALMRTAGYLNEDKPFIISEIRIHDPATPDEETYCEIYNTSQNAVTLQGVGYAVIGDDSSDDDGVIDAYFNLTPWFEMLDGEDFWTVATDSFTLGTADQTTTLIFENGDNVTHMLLRRSALEEGCDVDLNNDGVLDYMPWAEVLDSVAVKEDSGSVPLSSEWWYADDTIGPNGLGDAPGHVYRCFTTGDWEIGPSDPDIGEDSPDASNPFCVDFRFAGVLHEFFEAIGVLVDDVLHVTGGAGDGDFGVRFVGEYVDFMCIELFDFSPASMPDGASLRGTATGSADGMPGQGIATLFAGIAGDTLTLSAEFPGAGSTLQNVTLLRDGDLIAMYEEYDLPIIIVSPPIYDPPILEFAPKDDELPFPLEAGGTFTFLQDVEVIIAGPGEPVMVDQIVFEPSMPVQYDYIENIDLIANGMDSFAIAGELIGKFGHPHLAHGAAQFTLMPNVLTVAQLDDADGGDGFSIPMELMRRVIVGIGVIPPPETLPDGAFVRVSSTGSVDGEGGVELGGLGIHVVSDSLSMTADFSALGATGIDVYFYDELGDLVGQQVIDAPSATVAAAPSWPTQLGRGGWPTAVDPSAAVSCEWPDDVEITLGEGQPPVIGRRLVIVPIGGPIVAHLERIGVRAGSGVDSLSVVSETVDLIEESEPCVGDVDESGTVDVLDLLTLLAAWGSGGGPSDLNYDGVVDVLDLLILLGAWGPCP